MTTPLLALALGALAVGALASCGSASNAELLPGNTASQITANLDRVKQLARGGECAGARSAAQRVSEQINALNGVNRRLKQALGEGATRLNEVLAECEEKTSTEATEPSTVPNENSEPPGKEKEKKPGKEPKGQEKGQTLTEATPPPQSNGKGHSNGNGNGKGGDEGGGEGPSAGGVAPGAPAGGG